MTMTIDRRDLFRAGGGLLAATAVGTLAPNTATAAEATADATAVPAQLTTRNPLVEQRADPFITRPVNGMYYLTGSVPEYDRVVVRGAATIDGLATAKEKTVWRRPSSGKMGGHIWAPELHRIDGRWYIYFAAGDSDNVFRIRTYVLESTSDDPRADTWVPRGQMVTKWDTFTLDSTTFEHRGKRYFAWAQSEPGIETNSNLYLAEMASPLALKGDPVRLAVPTLPWEIQGFKVNEGPAVIIRNGRVFMTYSASATDARYRMGLLTADERSDLLDPRSWTKSPQPVFTTNEATRQYGPGHNSFTVAEDGRTDVLVYHARDYRDITGDPLYDPNRHTRVQRLYWNNDGTPSFGVPVGKGGPCLRLSPLDAPASYVRHYEYRLTVDGDVRELADSQFRIVAGFRGAGTMALQSVNFPDRYVRVVDGATVRIDPYDESDAYGRAASFTRVPGLADAQAVSFRLLDDSATYLAHDNGRILPFRPGARVRDRQRVSYRLS
ncbi:alpha-arabinofuranosidase [Amycolatopsis regifaucium]|uniref:Alpha-arabinofuranosidase n=2 Tax=Amycolatopsis regifaucium TaxID=546365 RepID=A0A154MPC1_9PSEU|nr:alpha-arabinofuranosidase [Amycolatopsis regifaucium]OKA05043.1 alpha-arabinofuranosidase [Amycolatopsis regifaucium]